MRLYRAGKRQAPLNSGGCDMGVSPASWSRRKRPRFTTTPATAVGLGVGTAAGVAAASTSSGPSFAGYHAPALVPASYYRDTNNTASTIKHLVVIFGENETFDHSLCT